MECRNEQEAQSIRAALALFTLRMQLVAASTMIAAAWVVGSDRSGRVALAAGLLLALRTARRLDEAAGRLEIIPAAAESPAHVQRFFADLHAGGPAALTTVHLSSFGLTELASAPALFCVDRRRYYRFNPSTIFFVIQTGGREPLPVQLNAGSPGEGVRSFRAAGGPGG